MKRVWMVLLALCLMATTVQAADLKVGYVDLQKALALSEAGKTAKAKLDSEVKAVEEEVKQRQSDLTALQESLKKQVAMLSDEAKREKELEFQQQVKDYQRFVKDKQEEMRGKEMAFTQQILRDLGKQVVDLSEAEKVTVMMEKGQLVYAVDSIDYTDKLIKAYDKVYKEGHK
ncbi:MAG: OmpH family outer membrane protein [Desulfuromonadaceae bacterium]|nr:OmpH family outer membrane protein [Desulfuromonadaceae bacterium]